MRPPFAYYGGKTGLAPKIADLFPPHRAYLEPFFGSGAVLFAKPRSRHEIVNDLDSAVVTFFHCLRTRREELEEVCALTPYARDEFNAAELDDDDLDDLELARRFWVRVNQSFAKSAGRQTGFSVTTARTQAGPASVWGRLGRFAEAAERLSQVTIENCDAIGLVERFGTGEAVVYCDPPYLAETRRSRKAGTACADYRSDMGDAVDHERLSKVLHATDAAVFLSGYHSELYDDLYSDWARLEWSVNVHSSNSVTNSRDPRTEVVWSNRPLGRDTQGVLL